MKGLLTRMVRQIKKMCPMRNGCAQDGILAQPFFAFSVRLLLRK